MRLLPTQFTWVKTIGAFMIPSVPHPTHQSIDKHHFLSLQVQSEHPLHPSPLLSAQLILSGLDWQQTPTWFSHFHLAFYNRDSTELLEWSFKILIRLQHCFWTVTLHFLIMIDVVGLPFPFSNLWSAQSPCLTIDPFSFPEHNLVTAMGTPGWLFLCL